MSSEKADVDEEKGQSLEEMSKMVHEFNIKIGDRKSKLAPIIKGCKIYLLTYSITCMMHICILAFYFDPAQASLLF